MHHHFFTLQSHLDVTKFEFEDGVIRNAAASLLREESTIRHILADLPTERAFPLDGDIDFPKWDGSILISSAEPDDVDPTLLAELLIDVAAVVENRSVTVIDGSDLEAKWVGTATPGPKISFVTEPGSGIDGPSFAAWMRDMLDDVAANYPGIGCRGIGPIDIAPSTSADAILSFWFPDSGLLDTALAERFYDPIVNAGLVEAGSVRAWSTVEHRLAPNPNAWDMPTGRLMPEPPADDE